MSYPLGDVSSSLFTHFIIQRLYTYYLPDVKKTAFYEDNFDTTAANATSYALLTV